MLGKKSISCLYFLILWIGLHSIGPVAASATSRTITVPDDYPTIQAAIDAAGGDDIVQIRDGTYKGPGNVNLDTKGKGITITSMNGPEGCIIDSEQTSRAFLFSSGEWPKISGLTLTRGLSADDGGSILIHDGYPTIINCIFTENEAASHGGAIKVEKGYSTITQCEFIGNKVTSGNGGAIAASAPVNISRSTFRDNSADSGGAISVSSGASLNLSYSTLIENQATSLGGGIHADSTTIYVTSCTMDGNRVIALGGAGGGIGVDNSTILVVLSSVLVNNKALQGAAIISRNESTLIVTNSTFFGNIASIGHAALELESSTSTAADWITNCILWKDQPNEIAYSSMTTPPEVSYSDIQNGYSGSGNIDADPKFYKISAATPSLNEYRLQMDSPCIDAGDSAAPFLPSADRDGCSRVTGTSVDMGAYEVQTVTVNASVHMEDGTGTPVTVIYPAQKVQPVVEFTNLSSLEVPPSQLIGRTLKVTFALTKPAILSRQIVVTSQIDSQSLTKSRESILVPLPTITPTGPFTFTGTVEISGLQCLANTSNSTGLSVEPNPPVTFTYPFALPAASSTVPPANAYRMIGEPVVPSPNADVFYNFKDFFGGVADPNVWRMFLLNVTTGGYSEINGLGQDDIDFAKGWWIISSNPTSLTFTGLPQRWDDRHLLRAGYQMISCPFFDTEILWSKLVANNPVLAGSVLYEWDGSGNYIIAASMVPGKAYWLWSPRLASIIIRRSYAASGGKFVERSVTTGIPGSGTVSNISKVSKVAGPPPPPLPPGAFVKVLSPKGGEVLKSMSVSSILWSSLGISPQGAGGTVRISYSLDGGKSYKLIASNVKNTGRYRWLVPRSLSKRCLIRVTSTLYPSMGDTSDRLFSIR